MAVFTIFWCAVFGIAFWLLSLLLKSVQSVIEGLYDAVSDCGFALFLGIVGIVFFLTVYTVVNAFRTGSFFLVIIILLALGIVVTLGGSVGIIAVELIIMAVSCVFEFCKAMLTFINTYVEGAYIFFLNKIKQKVDAL